MRPRTLLLFLPMVVYLAIVMYWHAQGVYLITGDEPHYLIMTESLLHDGDLVISNNYTATTPVAQEIPEIVIPAGKRAPKYSIHGVGLPILLLPGYALGGVLGAKLWLAMIIGLTAPVVYHVARGILPEHSRWPFAIALLVGLSLPFVSGAGQLYPDMIAGLILLWLLGARLRARPNMADGLLLAFLPWLHIKLTLPAVIIGLAFAQAAVSRRHSSRPWPPASFLLPPVISLLVLGFYNWWAFGAILGPYQPRDASSSPIEIAMIFLGLHIDRMQGMFFQAPLLLLGVFGLAAMVAENRRLMITTSLVYLAVMLPQAAHTNWYGGTSFAGRFFWTAVPLWCLPLVYAVRMLSTRSPAPAAAVGSDTRWRMIRPTSWALLAFIITAILAQVVFIWKILIFNGFIYNSGLNPAASWTESNPYTDFFDISAIQLARLIPSFHDFDSYLHSSANWIFIGLLAYIALVGYCTLHGHRWVTLAITGTFVVAIAGTLWLVPPVISPLDLSASMPHGINEAISINPALPHGLYGVSLKYTLSGDARWQCIQRWPDGRRTILTTTKIPASTKYIIAACAIPQSFGEARFSVRLRGGVDVERLLVWPLMPR